MATRALGLGLRSGTPAPGISWLERAHGEHPGHGAPHGIAPATVRLTTYLGLLVVTTGTTVPSSRPSNSTELPMVPDQQLFSSRGEDSA